MAEPYLRELKSIVERASVSCEGVAHITCKHFFSGAAAYVDGQIFMTLTTVGLALKLSPGDRNTLFEQGATPLQYFPKAPVKKDYVLTPLHLIDDDAGLRDWISRSIEFVRK
jgi:TfoX/Sxy family transcriptional regulator of competence genes